MTNHDQVREATRRGWMMEVQAWHILCVLAIQLIGLGMAYGKITQQQEDMRKDIMRIENQRAVTKDDFDEWKQQLTERMGRIESKLDAELKFR